MSSSCTRRTLRASGKSTASSYHRQDTCNTHTHTPHDFHMCVSMRVSVRLVKNVSRGEEGRVSTDYLQRILGESSLSSQVRLRPSYQFLRNPQNDLSTFLSHLAIVPHSLVMIDTYCNCMHHCYRTMLSSLLLPEQGM